MAVRNPRPANGPRRTYRGHRQQVDVRGAAGPGRPGVGGGSGRGWDGPLDILVNNAGVMASPLMRTPQGWEMQFATNHLGHFALARGLHRRLAAADGARVVSVSSAAHLRSAVGVRGHSVRASASTSRGRLTGSRRRPTCCSRWRRPQRWADDGITVNALHPGGIRTNLQRYITEGRSTPLRRSAGSGGPELEDAGAGAATSVLLAASPLVDGISGRYFEDCNEAGPHQPGTRTGVAAYALDPGSAAMLWKVSEQTIAG